MNSYGTARKWRNSYHAGWEIVKQWFFLPGKKLPFKAKCAQWTAWTVLLVLQQVAVIANASLSIFILMCWHTRYIPWGSFLNTIELKY